LILVIFVVGLWIENQIRKIEIKNKPPIVESTIQKEKVTVLRVIDGDTIELIDGRKVRYIGVDSPETGSKNFLKSKIANQKLVEKKTVQLEKDVSDTDKYSRLLRYVWIDDKFINLEMIKNGMARVATFPPDIKYAQLFLSAEKEARMNQ